MFSKKFIRILSIILAGLMILSACAVLVQVFAADVKTPVQAAVNTGDNDLDYIVPAVLIAVAVLVVVICLVLPKIRKKEEE